jgi:transposase
VTGPQEPLPTDLAAAHALILRERAARLEAEAVAAAAQADLSSRDALIGHLQLLIEKLKREKYGQRSERTARLIDQLEFQLEELEAAATEDELQAEKAAGALPAPYPSRRKRPVRKAFPDHLPRERVVIEAPSTCPCCGSAKLSSLGEDVTETLEVIPRRWKIIETVRKKVSCRDCEKITQPPAPFHTTPRGYIGPALLATILFDKFAQHLPLNRQSRRFGSEGIDLSVSTLADQVGAGVFALMPLYQEIEAHVLAAERLHGDDTTIPILAETRTVTGRVWSYVRDDRPFGGAAAPAALFYASADRRGEHPARHLQSFAGILQADAYSGFNPLFDTERRPKPITVAFCWAHSRRYFFELADIGKAANKKRSAIVISPIALEAVKRIDALFEIEREINGRVAEERLRIRQERSLPLVNELHSWLQDQRSRLSQSSKVIEPIDYMLKRWDGFTRFLKDGRVCLSNNAAERSLRCVALGRNYAHHVIMRSSPREAPAGRTRRRFPARQTAHNSKALKELHQLVRRPIPAGARSDRLQPVEGAFLH